MPCIKNESPNAFSDEVGDVVGTAVFVCFDGEKKRSLGLQFAGFIATGRELAAVGEQVGDDTTVSYGTADRPRTDGV